MSDVNKQLLDALKRLLECYKMADHGDGYCCCGSPMDRHDDPINCGHSAVDAGEYNANLIIKDVESVIAAAEQAQQARLQCACGDSFTSDAVCANCLCTQTVAVPDGYALVPIEPTREMFKAVNKLDDEMFAGGCAHGANFEQLWEAAILAAPKP